MLVLLNYILTQNSYVLVPKIKVLGMKPVIT